MHHANHIHNEEAYENAIQRYIMANATKGRMNRWHAEDSTRQALMAQACDSRNEFARKMYESYEKWGSLTPAQESALRASFAKAESRKAELIAQDSVSQHVGSVGERLTLRLSVAFVVEIDSDYGVYHITGMRDSAGNIYIYKGNRIANKGATWQGKATVKAHSVREGINQTILNRPKGESV